MKVIHVETGMHLYGGALQVFYLLRGLREHEGEHVLVCPPGAAVGKAVAELGIRVIETPCRGDLDIGFIGRLLRIIRREQADIVHLHSRRGADLLGGIAAKWEGVRCVLTRRVDNPEPRWWVKRKYRLYDRVIAISEGIRQVLLSEGAPAAHVQTIHSAVDTQAYRPERDDRWFKQTFDLPDESITVGMIAQFIPRKGHATLLDAIPEIIRTVPSARFVLLGQGPLLQEIKKQVEAAKLTDHVRLPGFRHDMARVLPNLDVLVHPASMEGLGVSLLQAAACGVPVVATPVGGIPEIVQNGENGYLVPAEDSKELARAVRKLASDASTREAMGLRGREIVLERFSIDQMVAKNRAIYGELLDDISPSETDEKLPANRMPNNINK